MIECLVFSDPEVGFRMEVGTENCGFLPDGTFDYDKYEEEVLVVTPKEKNRTKVAWMEIWRAVRVTAKQYGGLEVNYIAGRFDEPLPFPADIAVA